MVDGPIGPAATQGAGAAWPVRQRPAAAAGARRSPGAGEGFAAVLDEALQQEQLRFSAHARLRLGQRGIRLDEAALHRLGEAVRRAEGKGAREAVVLMEDVAYVVSVRNRTVITVVDGPRLRENVFTNIDSVVIA